ncbi:MAG: hypothetical protein IH594_11700, partial [Bacteroidales bacterium]|nr:hypothetical protein [Bacteroidales bacterium]
LGPQFTFAGQLELNQAPEKSNTNQVQGYSFQCNERAVLIAWVSEKEASTVKLNVPEGVNIINIAGTKLPSSTEIALSVSPVYIVSDSMTAIDLLKSCKIKIL